MSENGPMWLTRSDDVVAHLYFAAAEIGTATLEIASLRVPGSLSFPNAELGTFSFFSHGEVDLESVSVEPGRAVQFDYSQGDSTYSFISEVIEVSQHETRRRWRIRFPKVIERNQKRLVRRHRVMGRSGFFVTTDRVGDRQRLGLYDIATAGLSFVVPTRNDLQVGDSFAATLHVPGCDPLAAKIELRNMRPLPGDKTHKLAGCRFVSVSDDDRQALSSALALLT